MFKFILAFCLLLPALAAQGEGRDPTLPGNLPSAPQTNWVQPDAALNLSAILITDTGKRAIINGVTLKSGQHLDDATRLMQILPGRVIVKQRDTIKTLTLVPSVKKPLK